jgi:hypothetical protein
MPVAVCHVHGFLGDQGLGVQLPELLTGNALESPREELAERSEGRWFHLHGPSLQAPAGSAFCTIFTHHFRHSGRDGCLLAAREPLAKGNREALRLPERNHLFV